MAIEFDPRILKIGIEFGNTTIWYEGLDITAQGTRYGTDVNSECQIRIDNITQEHRDYILKRTSPFSPFYLNPLIHVTVMAGRESYGPTLVYYGVIQKSAVTQPPDIGVILQCLTAMDQSLNIISYSSGPQINLSSLCQKAADTLGVTLNFQATDKTITNFTLTGRALDYVTQIQEAGNVTATIDNKTLIVADKGVAIIGPIKTISEATGMIGIPEFCDIGVRVKYLFDNNTQLLQTINIVSKLNPGINGNYLLNKLGFDLASRQTPFYWIAECAPIYDAGADFNASGGEGIA